MDNNTDLFPERQKRPGDISLEDKIHTIGQYYSPLISALEMIMEETHSPEEDTKLREMYSRLEEIRDSWVEAEKEYLSPDTGEDRKTEIGYSVEEWYANLLLIHSTNGEKYYSEEMKLPPYRIVIDPETGLRSQSTEKTWLWGDRYFVPGEGILEILRDKPGTKALEELQKLSDLPSPSNVRISKDLISSEFQSQGDVLEVGTEEEKKILQKYQKKGKLLFGSLEGLSGGTAFFKSVSIALAKILNEQSNYYNTDTGIDRLGGHLLTGVPKEKIREIFGDSAKLEEGSKKVSIREGREFPYIILSYERLAKEVSKTGKITGGKDIEYIRLYLNGGYREFETDPKTGTRKPIPSSYVPGLSSKKYPVSDGKGHFIFLPFLVNEGEIVDTTRKDPEVGCLLRLSPQYSKTLRGYTSLRGDTIQLIGGGRQKDITMDIISFLVFSRNSSGILRKRKSEILAKYENRPNYKDSKTGRRRVKKLEEHFREAIQKSVEAKILRPGTDKRGNLLGYREERNSGGEIISVFLYNPDYLRGEDTQGDPETEFQEGREV